MKRLLFVCTGNTCRSPMAEAIFRHKSNDIEVKSAGVYAMPGSDASPHAKQVLEEKGISHQHCGQSLTSDLIDWADLILTMTENHKRAIVQTYPLVQERVFTLKEYLAQEGVNNHDIGDPFGGSLETYRQTARELETAIDQLLNQLNNE